MNKLSKEKRNQLIMATVLIVVAMAALWFGLIRFQQQGLQRLADRKQVAERQLRQIQETIKNHKLIETELASVTKTLDIWEEDMASGDLYSSMIQAITKFKAPYHVDIPTFISSGGPVDSTLLPKFPYRQYSISVGGVAYYHELGKFIADFENRFPSSRVLNLELAPASALSPDEKEKLSFKMDIVSLVQPGGQIAKIP